MDKEPFASTSFLPSSLPPTVMTITTPFSIPSVPRTKSSPPSYAATSFSSIVGSIPRVTDMSNFNFHQPGTSSPFINFLNPSSSSSYERQRPGSYSLGEAIINYDEDDDEEVDHVRNIPSGNEDGVRNDEEEEEEEEEDELVLVQKKDVHPSAKDRKRVSAQLEQGGRLKKHKFSNHRVKYEEDASEVESSDDGEVDENKDETYQDESKQRVKARPSASTSAKPRPQSAARQDFSLSIAENSSASSKSSRANTDRQSSSTTSDTLTPPSESSSSAEWIIQDSQCLSRRFAGSKKCQQCTSKYTGFKCGFVGFRGFLADKRGSPIIGSTRLRPSSEPDDEPQFVMQFNEPFHLRHAERIKTAAAAHLLPTLMKELEHARRPDCVKIRRDLVARDVCDACLTVVFCGAYKCMRCARDLCAECYKELARAPSTEPVTEARQRRKNHLTACTPRNVPHAAKDFSPFTRMDASELEGIIADMQAWNALHASDPPVEPASEEVLAEWRRGSGEPDESTSLRHIYLKSKRQLVSPFEDSSEPVHFPRFSFESIWALREPIVVKVGLDLAHLEWTPRYFIEKYGRAACQVYTNRRGGIKEEVESTTVGEFFSDFGKPKELGTSRKIKDWPSTTDFKSEFPLEYEDFMQLIPVGCVTRRDGVLNVAAHAPLNSNPPDLGPKGYFSEASDDRKGGQGSTKLHMDIADAVNIMLWAGDRPDGKPGAAAWDLFRPEDANKIREFLYEHIANRDRCSLEEAQKRYNDPIHSQHVFLDESLRAQLLAEKGVKPFRIFQRPGDAVFIPAGCAHQVCNLVDCIKVASDFVSIQNIASCWNVTDEFRTLTKEVDLWRTDVLQLKAQLLWAWKSSDRLKAKV